MYRYLAGKVATYWCITLVWAAIWACVPGAMDDAFTRQTALVFVKPHANNAAVVQLVKEVLAAAKVTVLAEGDVTGARIDQERIIDRHYATIARYATEWSADKVTPSAEASAQFEAAFGETWADAVAASRVVNAAEAQQRLGGLSVEELTSKWQAAEKKVKLAPGLYAGRFDADNIYVLNGFYLANRAKFTAADAVVHWLTVEWDEAALSWADFRGKLIGPTNPSAAPAESIRGTILARWSELGLKAEPNVSDNGVHASAGPLEGIAERALWTGARVEDDPATDVFLGAGVPLSAIRSALSNPPAQLNERVEPLFDLLENSSTRQCAEYLQLYARNVYPHPPKADEFSMYVSSTI
jgi:hypothetical protein